MFIQQREKEPLSHGQSRHRQGIHPPCVQAADLRVPVAVGPAGGQSCGRRPLEPRCTRTEGIRSQRDFLQPSSRDVRLLACLSPEGGGPDGHAPSHSRSGLAVPTPLGPTRLLALAILRPHAPHHLQGRSWRHLLVASAPSWAALLRKLPAAWLRDPAGPSLVRGGRRGCKVAQTRLGGPGGQVSAHQAVGAPGPRAQPRWAHGAWDLRAGRAWAWLRGAEASVCS